MSNFEPFGWAVLIVGIPFGVAWGTVAGLPMRAWLYADQCANAPWNKRKRNKEKEMP